jgi:AraC-like DNA-binding protein
MSPEALAAVPPPLRALRMHSQSDASQFAAQTSRAWGERLVVPMVTEQAFATEFSLLDLGGVVVNVARVTPVLLRQEPNDAAGLMVKFSGDCVYRHGTVRRVVSRGEALLTRNDGGSHHCEPGSGIGLAIDFALLNRSVSALLGGSDEIQIDSATVLGRDASATLFCFFDHVDQLLLQDRCLPQALGLGSQLYRYLAVALLQQNGQMDRLRQRQQRRRQWKPGLDELVDQIRANRHLPLTITDLEHQSHYSARHLTTLFRERFNCTPMQFVRRQRLDLAMERLTAPQPEDTVIRIARECGYRHASNFSVDFQREFGSKPSDVLRLSRGSRTL